MFPAPLHPGRELMCESLSHSQAASSMALCGKKLCPNWELQYTLLRVTWPLAPPCKGFPGFFSYIPHVGLKPGGCQAGKKQQNHCPEALGHPPATETANAAHPFLQPAPTHISGQCWSYTVDESHGGRADPQPPDNGQTHASTLPNPLSHWCSHRGGTATSRDASSTW